MDHGLVGIQGSRQEFTGKPYQIFQQHVKINETLAVWLTIILSFYYFLSPTLFPLTLAAFFLLPPDSAFLAALYSCV